MIPVIDQRASLQGLPGLHALIVGISAYPYLPKENETSTRGLGMRQLSSAALTAYKMYRWLIDSQKRFPVELASCRLLLLPSSDEIVAEPNLNDLVRSCALNDFLNEVYEWRDDASSHPGNMTFFYFAGHGIQRTKDDAVLLLEDFADGKGSVLKNAVEMSNLFNGMASSTTKPKMARTQLYFVDSCRNLPSKFKSFEWMSTTPIFDIELGGTDNRLAPIFYASVPGGKAVGLKGKQTLFSKALLDCLNGAAGVPIDEDSYGKVEWGISIYSLSKALNVLIEDLNTLLGTQQECILSGLLADTKILSLNDPPLVDVVLEVDPLEALGFTKISVLDSHGRLKWELQKPLNPHPYLDKWPAGTYIVKADIVSDKTNYLFPFVDYFYSRPVMPPHCLSWKVRVDS
jgi:hypothetical protein